jgi:hypothetical protein
MSRRCPRKILFYITLGVLQVFLVLVLAGLLNLERLPASWQGNTLARLEDKTALFLSPRPAFGDMNFKEIKRLGEMIQLVTEGDLGQQKAWRYASLIYHAARKYEVNPLEIVALIMAESAFKADSVNRRTGDYGLGQINWEYWGKPLGLAPQDLLEPSTNIVMTCHVYKFFGEDFGKYHRGNGIQSKAYIVNIKSILSTLVAFGKTNEKDSF